VLRVPTDTGNGGFTTRSSRPRGHRRISCSPGTAIVAWQRLAYGWMGRSPDYQAALLGTFGVNADMYGPFSANASRW